MLGTALSTLLSHWRHHPGQALTLVAGLVLATALWSGVQAINTEARAAYDRAAAALGQDSLSRLVRDDGAPVPLAEYIALRRAGYLVSPVISGVLRDGAARLRILGIDPLTAPAEAQAPAFGGTGADIDFAGFVTAPGLLLLNEASANGPLPDALPPVAISANVPPGAAVTDIATAARLLAQTDPSYLLVAPKQPQGLPPLRDSTSLTVAAPQSGSDVARLTDSFHLNLTAFGLLSFAVGLFIVHGAIGLAFEQRRASFRTLRALGLPARTLLTAIGVETAILALIAGTIGLILGYAVAAALMPGVAGTLQGLYGADVTGVLGFDPLWAAAALGMTLLGAGAATAQPMLRTARMPILETAQPRAWAQASRHTMRRQAGAALALLVAGVVLALTASGLIAGFGVLAALLLAAALLLPGALGLMLKFAGRFARSETAEWLFADTRQQLPSLSLALMALLLALAANIGVSTMVGSFRTTFTGWLDQRLASELYISIPDGTDAADLRAFLLPRTEAILPITSVEGLLTDRPADIFGIFDHPTYRDNWPLLAQVPEVWDLLANGDGILINEQLSRRANLSPGDPLPVTTDLTLPVLGVYSDYGNPQGQAILGLPLFEMLYPAAVPRQFALRTAPGTTAEVASALRDDFGLPADAVINQEQVKAFSLSVFEQTFLITGALNVLTLGVAGFALLTSLLTLSTMRLPQLAPVWAIGMTRARLARFEVGRSLILGALTFILALPVGLALAWVLLAVVNVEAFGWRLPMELFPGDWARLFGLALLAAALAAAWPARQLARISPTRFLQVFSHDR